MAVNLPYELREGEVAYAAKVMANFRALMGAYNLVNVEGLGTGDVATMLGLLYQAMVQAGESGNAGDIVFSDGETLPQKFNAGTLNASLLDSEGLFYFFVDQDDGHLYVTAAEGINEGDFSIDVDGHLIYELSDPADSNTIHTYDLGLVRGPQGAPGAGGMSAAVYDPNSVGKDLNTYTGYFICYAANWDDGVYTLSDTDKVSGAALADHITTTTGHALIGPATTASDAAVTAWADGQIRVTAQGNGTITLKALGTTPTSNVDLQITMFV